MSARCPVLSLSTQYLRFRHLLPPGTTRDATRTTYRRNGDSESVTGVTRQCERFTIFRWLLVRKIAGADCARRKLPNLPLGDGGLASLYSGRKQLGCWFAGFECPQALANVLTQQGDRNPPEAWRIAVEPPQRRLQQQHGSQWIVALQVMKRRSHLDQPLQERFLRLGRPQPHAFPSLMRGKKLARIVQSQAFCQSAFAPIEFHHPSPMLPAAWNDWLQWRLERSRSRRSASETLRPRIKHIARQPRRVYTVRQHWKSQGNPDSLGCVDCGTPCLPPAIAGVFMRSSPEARRLVTPSGAARTVFFVPYLASLFPAVRCLVFRLPNPCTHAGFAADSRRQALPCNLKANRTRRRSPLAMNPPHSR